MLGAPDGVVIEIFEPGPPARTRGSRILRLWRIGWRQAFAVVRHFAPALSRIATMSR